MASLTTIISATSGQFSGMRSSAVRQEGSFTSTDLASRKGNAHHAMNHVPKDAGEKDPTIAKSSPSSTAHLNAIRVDVLGPTPVNVVISFVQEDAQDQSNQIALHAGTSMMMEYASRSVPRCKGTIL